MEDQSWSEANWPLGENCHSLGVRNRAYELYLGQLGVNNEYTWDTKHLEMYEKPVK